MHATADVTLASDGSEVVDVTTIVNLSASIGSRVIVTVEES